MSFNAGAMPLGSDSDYERENSAEATGGGKDPVRWVVIEKTMGLMPAQLSANFLNHEGIPARAWQEGAGTALGLTVGILGTGYVEVPEEYEKQATDILEEIANAPIDWEDSEMTD